MNGSRAGASGVVAGPLGPVPMGGKGKGAWPVRCAQVVVAPVGPGATVAPRVAPASP